MTLSFWQGWGAVALCAALLLVAALVAALVTLRVGRAVRVAAWVACAALVALAFPGHLLFQLPAALVGEPTDWRDVLHRLVQLGGGLLFGAAASAGSRGCAHPRVRGSRPAPAWLRGWALAGFLVPVVGFTVPHVLWVAGVPLGISADLLDRARADLAPVLGVALAALPALGGVLTLGLASRWGRVFPRSVPLLAGRRVPPLLALIPAGVVAVALIAYGVLGIWLIAGALVAGTTTWSELLSGWAASGTELVFLLWGIALGVATLGYHQITRPRCEICGPSRPAPAARGAATPGRPPGQPVGWR